MIKRIKFALLAFVAVFMFAMPVLVPALASADTISQGLCNGANFQADTTQSCDSVNDTQANDRINHIITVVINAFSLVVGIAAVIMIIVGGLKYIISGGEAGNVTSAKNTILYAIIGLVVVALAQFVVKFVLNKVAGS
ncbi:MAG: pilin [Candidatus Saccharimonadales bacterium]